MEKLIGEITTDILIDGATWVKQYKPTTTKWHEVLDYSVYVYDAMSGGYGSIVNARTVCGTIVHIDEAELTHKGPANDLICTACKSRSEKKATVEV